MKRDKVNSMYVEENGKKSKIIGCRYCGRHRGDGQFLEKVMYGQIFILMWISVKELQWSSAPHER